MEAPLPYAAFQAGKDIQITWHVQGIIEDDIRLLLFDASTAGIVHVITEVELP